MAEDDTDPTGPPLPGMPAIDEELERLRERLGALHASVDDLGREPPSQPPPSPTVAIPAGAGSSPAAPAAESPGPGAAPPVPPSPARPAAPPAGDVPAAGAVSAVSASFVVVDAGPLAGLAAARCFEDALAALPAVREVRLRRFSRRRAEIEVGLSAPHALGPELPLLERAVEVEAFRRDRIVLRLPSLERAAAGGVQP